MFHEIKKYDKGCPLKLRNSIKTFIISLVSPVHKHRNSVIKRRSDALVVADPSHDRITEGKGGIQPELMSSNIRLHASFPMKYMS